MKLTHTTAATVAAALLTSAVGAESVRVTVQGQVESLVPGVGLFASVSPGDDASMSFTIDTNVFDDGSNALTRGYPINVASFSMTVGTVAVDLAPLGGETAYFVLFDHPSIDMFQISTNPDVVVPPSLQQAGAIGPLSLAYHQSFSGSTLQSLDILDAVRPYPANEQLTFDWAVDDQLLSVAELHPVSVTLAVESQHCPADISGPNGAPDGTVDAIDLLRLVAQWGGGCTGLCTADISGALGGPDGNVDAMDYAAMIAQWGGSGNCLSGPE
jgi:hypothetical protein